MEEELHAVNSFEKDKSKRKRKFKDIDSKITEALYPKKKTKMVIEFNFHESASIKSFAVKKRCSVRVTTRFLSGKMLMFTKLSLKSIIYEILETFCFPDENVKNIFKIYKIEKVEIFRVLTDTDSTSIKFIFISDPNSETPEKKYRDIIFAIITSSKICKRFDSSHEFWEIFGDRREQKRKRLGYFEIEHIDNPCILTLAVNQKKYLKLLEDKNLNKKHKGIKKGSTDLGFKNFAQRINLLVSFDTFEKPPADSKQVSILAVVDGEIGKTMVVKNKFSQ